MKIKLLLIIAMVSQMAISQQRTCGAHEHMSKLMQDPEKKREYLAIQEKFRAEYQKILALRQTGKNANATIRIPVAVHYPSAGAASAAVKTCLRNFAQNQINILNADYNAMNSDLSNWTAASGFYPGVVVGDLDVEFVLATRNHPAGTGLVNGDVAVTFGTDFLSNSDNDPTWAGYMNFVVRNISGGILGYSPLGGTPGNGATVVMDNNAFASGAGCTGYVPGAPYNLGRTVTHELGHFFNLDHTFANDNGCGTDDDGIADTPKVGEATYSCPADGSVAGCVAGQYALTMNYMDYVDDACMYMFTQGQADVMRAYYNAIASQFQANVLGNNEAFKSKFVVYPNPNKGSFNIQFEEVFSNYSIQVVDQSGRVVLDSEYAQNGSLLQTINLNATASGVYFVTIKTDNEIATKKVVVE
ncbi:zinc-dependent metalloprotease [Flavobacterium pedocola]